MRLLEWLITILILVCACGIFYTAFADTETTALPSWVHGEGYSECDEDVRVVVSLTPLKASDIKMLLTDDYEFVTVILYNGKFHWYFIRYTDCYNHEYYRVLPKIESFGDDIR